MPYFANMYKLGQFETGLQINQIISYIGNIINTKLIKQTNLSTTKLEMIQKYTTLQKV